MRKNIYNLYNENNSTGKYFENYLYPDKGVGSKIKNRRNKQCQSLNFQ